jgi:hypothetical protein
MVLPVILLQALGLTDLLGLSLQGAMVIIISDTIVLIVLATELEGYLYQLHGIRKQWSMRWVVIKKGSLRVYRKWKVINTLITKLNIRILNLVKTLNSLYPLSNK